MTAEEIRKIVESARLTPRQLELIEEKWMSDIYEEVKLGGNRPKALTEQVAEVQFQTILKALKQQVGEGQVSSAGGRRSRCL